MQCMSIVAEGILWLYEIGFFTSLLPFVLIYTIVYALMRKTGILGQPNYDALFAFCLGFFTIFRIDIVENLPIFFARVAILFVILVAVMLLSGMVGIQESYANKFVFALLGLYLVYITIDTFMGTDAVMSLLEQIPLGIIFGVVIVLGIFIAIGSFIIGSGSSSGSGGSSKLGATATSSGDTKRSNTSRESANKNSDIKNKPLSPNSSSRNTLPLRNNATSDDFDVEEVGRTTLDDLRKKYR